MQDRYSGDVGDFGKFGLLRHIIEGSSLKLGINWYLYPDEGHNEDGKFIRYISQLSFECCDRELHGMLKKVVSSDRSTQSLERAGLFTNPPIYYSKPVDFYASYPGGSGINKSKRLELRQEWRRSGISALSPADVVFLDPDNGLQIKSCGSLHQKKSGKFAYFDEIQGFHAQKKLTIIYHHLNRHKSHGNHPTQIRNRAHELKIKINPNHKVFGIRYRPYSPRAFFLIAAPSLVNYVEGRLNSFFESDWQQHWDNFYAE